MQETKERFFVFVNKLIEKVKEFAEASLPELIELNTTDTYDYKREYLRVKSAVLGQLDNILQKARHVQEDKITNFSNVDGSINSVTSYYAFRTECYNKFNELDELCRFYREKIEATYSEDFEAKYQKILNEYELIKDKFNCSQCGSQIYIDKIYFTTTYLTCASCSTRNTFEPSTQAKQLAHLGRSVAEQRTKYLLQEYEEIPTKSQSLYLQRHQLKLSIIHEKDKNIIALKEQQMRDLEQERISLENKAPRLYKQYLRVMFDEWNKITPDLTAEHEKFYNRLLQEQKTYNYE